MFLIDIWWVPALIASFFIAGAAEVNRRFKMGGRRLSFWQFALSVSLLSPTILLADWPMSPYFYAVAFINGMVMSYATIIQLRLAADYNGRIASLTHPFKIIFAFFIWAAMNKVQGLVTFDNALQMVGVNAVLIVMLASFLYMAREKMNIAIFKNILPISLMFAILDIGMKMVLEEGLSSVFVYVFIATLSAALTVFSFMAYRGRKKALWIPNKIKAGLILALCNVSGMLCFVTAIQASDNPSYPTIVTLLSGVWLLIFYRLKKVPDNMSPAMGTLLVFCAMLLIWLTKG